MLLKSNKGSVFIMVTLVLSIMLSLMGMLLAITATEARISRSYQDGVKAYYLAMSGIEQAVAFARLNPNDTGKTGTVSQISNSTYQPYSASWTLTQTENANEIYKYNLTSTATYNFKQVRSLAAKVTISSGTVTITELKQTN